MRPDAPEFISFAPTGVISWFPLPGSSFYTRSSWSSAASLRCQTLLHLLNVKHCLSGCPRSRWRSGSICAAELISCSRSTPQRYCAISSRISWPTHRRSCAMRASAGSAARSRRMRSYCGRTARRSRSRPNVHYAAMRRPMRHLQTRSICGLTARFNSSRTLPRWSHVSSRRCSRASRSSVGASMPSALRNPPFRRSAPIAFWCSSRACRTLRRFASSSAAPQS